MPDAHDSFSESHFRSRGSSTTYSFSELCGESNAGTPSLLECFTTAPEFKAFTEHLRLAAQVLTVRDFMRLRRHFEAVWLNILSEL